MTSCPNINAPEFKLLEVVYGRTKATSLFHKNNDKIPTLKEAIVLAGTRPRIKVVVPKNIKHFNQVQRAITKNLPAAVNRAITVVEDVSIDVLGRDDLFMSLKTILNDKGITDELLINWAGINKVNPKAIEKKER